MTNKPIPGAALRPLIRRFARTIRPYAGLLFFLLIAVLYAFLIVRINALGNAEVDQDKVDAQVQASPAPRIDAGAVRQLERLQDNSVNVQSLFQENRTNPFQE